MDIYTRIQNLANERGLTIQDLEKQLGFSRGSLYKFKNHSPSIDKIQAVAQGLRVSVSMLLGESSSESKYYFDDQTAEMAQTLYENKEMRQLFSTARDIDPDNLKALSNFLVSLKRKEQYNGEDPA